MNKYIVAKNKSLIFCDCDYIKTGYTSYILQEFIQRFTHFTLKMFKKANVNFEKKDNINCKLILMYECCVCVVVNM